MIMDNQQNIPYISESFNLKSSSSKIQRHWSTRSNLTSKMMEKSEESDNLVYLNRHSSYLHNNNHHQLLQQQKSISSSIDIVVNMASHAYMHKNHQQYHRMRLVQVTIAAMAILLQFQLATCSSISSSSSSNIESDSQGPKTIGTAVSNTSHYTTMVADSADHKVLKRSPDMEKMRYSFGIGKRFDSKDLTNSGNYIYPYGANKQITIVDESESNNDSDKQLANVRTLVEMLQNYQKKFEQLNEAEGKSQAQPNIVRETSQKRQQASSSQLAQRFSFGLGRKRAAELAQNSDNFNDETALDEQMGNSIEGEPEYELDWVSGVKAASTSPATGSSEIQNDEESIDKRKPNQYSFGIGKRTRFMPIIGGLRFGSSGRSGRVGKKVSNFEDFMKRRYSFGLGK